MGAPHQRPLPPQPCSTCPLSPLSCTRFGFGTPPATASAVCTRPCCCIPTSFLDLLVCSCRRELHTGHLMGRGRCPPAPQPPLLLPRSLILQATARPLPIHPYLFTCMPHPVLQPAHSLPCNCIHLPLVSSACISSPLLRGPTNGHATHAARPLPTAPARGHRLTTKPKTSIERKPQRCLLSCPHPPLVSPVHARRWFHPSAAIPCQKHTT